MEKNLLVGESKMNLLLLTKFYPFGKGETFIENEIRIMAEYFESITIIACEVNNKDNNIRKLPDNVIAFKVPIDYKSKDLIYGISYLFTKNKVVSAEKAECKNFSGKLFLAYFEAKSRRIYNYILKSNYIDKVVSKPFVIYSYWFFVTARVGTLIADKCTPVYKFTRAHRYDLYEEANKLKYLPYRKLFLQEYNEIFPCSENGSAYLKHKYPCLSDNVKTSFLGTKDYGISKKGTDGLFRIISCSRVEPVKRVDRIIEALHILENNNLNIEWIHIGDGISLKKILKKAKRNLHNIKYNFLGNLSNSEVLNLYSNLSIDLFINVSSSEGLPVSIMEAISFGIPVAATNVGGTSEIVIEGVTGTLIPPDFTNDELAEIVRKFYEKDRIYIKRDCCRKYWEEHFQANFNYHQLYDYLKKKYHL